MRRLVPTFFRPNLSSKIHKVLDLRGPHDHAAVTGERVRAILAHRQSSTTPAKMGAMIGRKFIIITD
eukprot:COSAG06_NODE_230_length_19685_cov_14.110844_16_plen_67_part_00